MSILKCLGTTATVAGLACVGITAMPHHANAWWHRGFGVGVWVPPVVVAPPPPAYYPPPVVYAPPPVYYPPAYYPAPRRVWVPPHWEGPYWVRGHWA